MEKHYSHSKENGIGFTDKIFFMLLIFSIAYIVYIYFQNEVLALLKMNPYVWAFVSHITGEISGSTILGLFYASFFGSLFFIFLPLELIFVYYLSIGHSPPVVMMIAILGNLAGLSLDYLFGYALGTRVVKFFLRKKFDSFNSLVSKWGSFIIFFGNMIIFPTQPISVVIGAARFPFMRFFILTVMGLFVKLFLLIVLNMYFGDYLTWFLGIF